MVEVATGPSDSATHEKVGVSCGEVLSVQGAGLVGTGDTAPLCSCPWC